MALSMRHRITVVCSFMLFMIFSNLSALAQNMGYVNQNNETGIPDYGSFIHTKIDSINLANGGVNIHLPLLTRVARTKHFRSESSRGCPTPKRSLF